MPTDSALARVEKIYAVVRRIPVGKVASYGQVAELAGLPRAARLVGNVMSKLPAGSDVPWHRVLNSKGEISIDPDAPAASEQRARLLEEGVRMTRRGVNMRESRWQVTLDEWLWGDWAQL